jgi:hypothetical protein
MKVRNKSVFHEITHLYMRYSKASGSRGGSALRLRIEPTAPTNEDNL